MNTNINGLPLVEAIAVRIFGMSIPSMGARKVHQTVVQVLSLQR